MLYKKGKSNSNGCVGIKELLMFIYQFSFTVNNYILIIKNIVGTIENMV